MFKTLKVSLTYLAFWFISSLAVAYLTQSSMWFVWYCGLYVGFLAGRCYERLY